MRLILVRTALLFVGATASVGASATGKAVRDDVLTRLGADVDVWERELGSVVTDETYEQTVVLTWTERWARVRDISAAVYTCFWFSTPRTERVDGEVRTAMDIRERARPTLVSGFGGRDVPLAGTVWFDARDGRVHRTDSPARPRAGTTGERQRARGGGFQAAWSAQAPEKRVCPARGACRSPT